MASDKQIEANRRNSLESTGPKTPEGKAASSRNAVKHGLTAERAVVSVEDRQEFEDFRRAFHQQFQPVGPVECFLVNRIVMSAWRITRIHAMETGLFELRLIDVEHRIDRDYTNLRPHDRLAFVFRDDCRDPNALTNLARYETRSERAFYRALHDLERLQAARRDPPPCQTKPISPTTQSPNHEVTQSPNSPAGANLEGNGLCAIPRGGLSLVPGTARVSTHGDLGGIPHRPVPRPGFRALSPLAASARGQLPGPVCISG